MSDIPVWQFLALALVVACIYGAVRKLGQGKNSRGRLGKPSKPSPPPSNNNREK